MILINKSIQNEHLYYTLVDMKFSIQKVLDHARLGIINGVERLPEITLESPNVVFYARNGTLPHLTPEVFQQITKENVMLYFPVPSIVGLHERMEKYNGTIGDFTGMPDHLTYVSVIDSGEKRIAGYHTKNHLPLWSKFGKTDINAQTYMKFMEALKPDMFATLCDNDTEVNSSNKRILKSVERTSEFFKECIEIYNQSKILKNSKMIGSLVGGFNKEAREKCSAVIAEAPIFGVSVDGLHDCSKEVELINAKQMKPLVEASLKYIPSDMLRICHGSWNPNAILELVSSGIDIFDTSYPYITAENGRAFTFLNDESLYAGNDINSSNASSNDEENGSHVNSICNSFEEPTNKKLKTSDSTLKFYISLSDDIHTESLEPISKYCTCYTCKNHTKAYIHHLLNVKELLGPTLLIMHNIHHYLKFFDTIRMSLKRGKFENLRHNFDRIYGGMERPDLRV